MKFYEFLNLQYDRKQLIEFVNKISSWDVAVSRKSEEIIPGFSAYRYKKDLFECSEIKRLASVFNIGYDKIQIAKFDPDFNFRPHIDYERKTCVLFPILPVLEYNPITYIIDKEEIDIHYYGPVITDTTLTHTVKGNGFTRINMQFDLDCTLDEGLNYVTSYTDSV